MTCEEIAKALAEHLKVCTDVDGGDGCKVNRILVSARCWDIANNQEYIEFLESK